VLNWTLVELNDETLAPSEAREKLQRLMTNSDRLCELIDQLIQTYDQGAVPADDDRPDHCDLAKIAVDCFDLQKPLAAMLDCQLELKAPPRSLEVFGNSREVSRVIDNLVRNGLKHNPAGTTVHLSLDENGDGSCVIEVSDNGRGIAPQDLSRIFEPGYRVNDH